MKTIPDSEMVLRRGNKRGDEFECAICGAFEEDDELIRDMTTISYIDDHIYRDHKLTIHRSPEGADEMWYWEIRQRYIR